MTNVWSTRRRDGSLAPRDHKSKSRPKGRAQPFIIPRHDWPRAIEQNERTLSNERLPRISATSLSEWTSSFLLFSTAIMINIPEPQTIGVNDTGKVEVKSELTVK